MVYNSKLVEVLEELATAYGVTGDTWRSASFSKAAKIVSDLTINLTLNNYKTIKTISGIGEGTLKRIEEFLRKRKLAELDKLSKDKRYKGFKELTGVMGFGKSHVTKLVSMGIGNLAELKKSAKTLPLTKVQQLGLKYYSDLKQKIPREETGIIGEIVKGIAEEVGIAPRCEVVGSYRRKVALNSDVDILMTSSKFEPKFIELFVARLEKYENLYIDTLSQGDTKVSFLIRSPVSKKVRQCDVRYVEQSSWPTALLYFTGNREANKIMRGIAKSKGYKLNEYGLYKGTKSIKVGSEQDVYKILGMEYLKPEERNL